MSWQLVIYGFGSYFAGSAKYEDIDILIVHQNIDYESCQFAIWCKRFLMSSLVELDITILSQREEQLFSFIEKSSAWRIGSVQEDSSKSDLCDIINRIREANI